MRLPQSATASAPPSTALPTASRTAAGAEEWSAAGQQTQNTERRQRLNQSLGAGYRLSEPLSS
jgi:hypothetical protein